ncbi:MAG: hypothetical protein P4L93_02315 [Coriobacteriia bacterium]|nr:hypothetical protein [Coriobacteriia bacterium]
MNSRTKAIIGTAVTVAVLAGVFFVGWSFSSVRKPPVPSTITLSPAQKSQNYYQQGLRALSSEDTSSAVGLFQSAIQADPNNSAAKSALDSATKPAPSTTTNTTKPTPAKPKVTAPDPFLKQVADIGKLLPASFPDYTLGTRQKLGSDATVTGVANLPTAIASNITWAVHDRKTASGARSFITETSKTLYPKRGAAVTIGEYTGYFGTDGMHFASIALARGRYVFEVTLTSANGSPTPLRALALQAMGVFPTKP